MSGLEYLLLRDILIVPILNKRLRFSYALYYEYMNEFLLI
jgi:hypothetical protein